MSAREPQLMTPGRAKLAIVIGAAMLLYVATMAAPLLTVTGHRPVEGTVVSAKVGLAPQAKGDQVFAPDITYEYVVDGRWYVSSRFGPLENNGGSQQWAEQVVRQYQPGSRCAVYYDPSDPRDSVLSKGANGSAVCLMTSIVFAGTASIMTGIAALRT